MSTVLLQKSTRAVAWIITASMALFFAAPQALAFENLGTFRYQWVSQSGTLSADGTAHEVAANPGDTVNMSMTIVNRSTNPQALVMYGKSALLDEGPSYPNAHAVGLGTSHPRDNVPAWIDSSSFAINGNRFTYYDGAPVNPGENMTLTWTVKISSTATLGSTYDLYTEIVREFDGWAQQVTANGAPIGNGDIFWRFLIGGTVTGGGDLNVATASTTPAAGSVAFLAADVPMTQITVTAGAADNALISSIAIRRGGLSTDSTITDLKIYDGTTQLGSTQGLNTTTHKATFTGLSWLIPAGTSKTLTVKATVAASGTANTGEIVELGIDSASDIILSGGGTVAGTFPVAGNGFTVAAIAVGYLAVTAPTSPASANVVSGTTDQDLGAFKFATSATEGFDINTITLTEVGTSVDSDVLNLKLKINGVQIGSTISGLTNGKVTFTGSPLFSVAAGQNKVVYIAADVASGVTSQRTIIFQVEETTSVVAYGQNSNGAVTITSTTGGTAFSTLSAAGTFTIIQGTLTLAQDATNLSAQAYVIGDEQIEVLKIKFSAASTEGVKITKLKLEENGDATATDYQNVRIYVGDSTTPIATSGSVSGTTTTFEDGNGLFEVAQSGNTVITIKLDISSSAASTDTLQFGVGNATTDYAYVTAYGLTSGDKIPQDSSHITLTTIADTDGSVHTIAAKGTFVISSGPNTPAAANVAKGVTGHEFTQFRGQAASEAMRVTAMVLRFYVGSGTGTAAATGDVNNVKLWVWNGSAWIQLGSTVSNPTTGVASFSFDYTVAKNTTDTFKVTGDIPTGTAAASLHADLPGAGTIGDDITTTGVSSAADVTETGSATGNLMTVVAPIVTVNASTVPGARTLVVNSDDVLLAKFFLSANDVEDIKISTIKIFTDIDGTMDGASAADLLTSGVYLRFDDGGTWRTTVADNWASGSPDFITFSGSDFNNPTEWVVPKGGSLVVEIRGDVIAAGTAYLGMTTAAANVVASGLSSGTAATIYDYQNNAYNQIWASPALTLSASGTITITAATDTPSVQQVTASYGSTTMTPTFLRIKLAGTSEAIEVDALRAKVADAGDASEDDNFAGNVYVYEGGTMSGNVLTGGTLVGTGTLIPVTSADAAADVVFSTPVTIPADGNAYLTLMADLTSMTNGADSGDVPYLGLDYNVQTGIWDANYADDYNVRATGVGSNAKIYSAGTISAILKGSAAYVVKTKLGMAVNSASPSGTATRQADHTIMKLNMTNTSAGTDARFRAAMINAMDASTDDFAGGETTAGTWTVTSVGDDGSTIEDYTTNYIDGTGSQRFTQGATTPVAGNGIKYTLTADDWSGYTGMGFWYRASRASIDLTVTLTGAGAGSHTVNPGTNDQWEFVLIPFASATTPFTGLTAITAINILSATAYTAADTVDFDRFVLYKDFIKMDMTSNAGLFAATGATNTAVTLKDASGGTTLATGYVHGTLATTFVSTSQAAVYWFPTTEMAIPASGKTYNVVGSTTSLITATSKDLTMSIGLGSASTAGAITAGNILWNDNSATTGIGWVDSPDGPLTRSLNF